MATNASTFQSDNGRSNYENVSDKMKQWNRAIPEAGYITLGTIRYGVKLAKPTTKHLSCTSSGDDKSIGDSTTTSEQFYNNSTSNSSHGAIDNQNCCCIGTSEIIMPWNRAEYTRTRLPAPVSSSSTSNNLIDTKNRTLSSSSSSIATQRTSQTVGGCLVIDNRDSSPPICCYTTSSSTKIPNIFSSPSKSTNNTLETFKPINLSEKVQQCVEIPLENKTKIEEKKEIESEKSSAISVSLIKNTNCDQLDQYDGRLRLNDSSNKNGNVAVNSAKNLNNNDKLKSFKCCASTYTTSAAADTTDQHHHYHHPHYQHNRDQQRISKRHHHNRHKNLSVDPVAIIRYGYMSPSTTLCHQNNEYKHSPKPTRNLILHKHFRKINPDITNTNARTSEYSTDNNDGDDGKNECNKSGDEKNNTDNDNDDDEEDDTSELSFIDSSVSQISSSTSDENHPTPRLAQPAIILRKNSLPKVKIQNVVGSPIGWNCILNRAPTNDSFDNCADTIPINKYHYTVAETPKLSEHEKPIVQNTIISITDEEEEIDFENKSIPHVPKHPIGGYHRIKVETAPKPLNYFGKNSTYNRLLPAPIMEKRRSTLDRWQKLGFGRRSSSTASADSKSTPPSKESKRGVEKTEKLRELTELLKRTRTNPAPIPPPRKPRPSIETQNSTSCSSLSISNKAESDECDTKTRGSDNVSSYPSFLFCSPPNPISKTVESTVDTKLPAEDLSSPSTSKSITDSNISTAFKQKETNATDLTTSKTNLNASIPNTDTVVTNQLNRPPVDEQPKLQDKEDDLFTALPKMESRTIVGAYTQKNIPYRSASFSQVDYSSGKYIRSAINAFKSNLNKQKGTSSVVENANLTLPRKRSGSKEQEINKDGNEEMIPNKNVPETYALNKIEENTNSKSKQNDVIEECCENETVETILEPCNRVHDVIKESDQEDVEENVNPADEIQCVDGLQVVQASEMILDSLCEEELALSSSPNKNVFQTATQCLIPVPVYECVPKDWEDTDTQGNWINACEDESAKSIEEVNVDLEKITKLETDTRPEVEPIPVTEEPDTKIVTENNEINFENQDPIIASKDEQILESIEIKSITLDDLPFENQSDLVTSDEPKINEPIPQMNLGEILDIPECVEMEQQPTAIVLDSPTIIYETVPSICVTSGNANGSGSENQKDHSTESSNLIVEIVEVRKRHSHENKTDKFSDVSLSTNDPNRDPQSPGNEDNRRRIDKSKRRKGIYFQWPAIDKDKSSEQNEWIDPSKDPLLSTAEAASDSNIDLSSLERLSSENLGWIECKTPEDNLLFGTLSSVEPTTPESDSTPRVLWPKPNRKQSLTCQSSEEKDESITGSTNSIKTNQKLNLLRNESISDNESDRTSPHGRASQSPAPSDQDLKRYSKRPPRGPYGQMLEAEMKKPAKLHYDEILEKLNRSESPNRLKDLRNDESSRLPVPCHTRASSTPIRTDLVAKDSSHKRFPSSIDSASPKKDLKNCYVDRYARKATSCDVSAGSEKIALSKKSENEKVSRSNLNDVRLSQSVRNLCDKSLAMSKDQLQPSQALLAELLKGSSEKLLSECRSASVGGTTPSALPTAVLKCLDTRTHVVIELFNTEQSYVESLETVVLKYLNPLKSQENTGIIDAQVADEIFYMVPAILNIHERFLEVLRRRLDAWEPLQRVGDAFNEVFSKTSVLDTYTAFVNNWNRAKDAIRTTSATRPAFARFLETMAREHKGKLTLDNLLIKPVQKFPNYELILSRLIKHTDIDHPDQKPLQEALKLVHDILLHLNCTEREALENDQRESTLRELEGVIEGINDLVVTDRQFLLFDLVSMPSGQAGRKDRGFFLFSDLLVITSIKRRSGTIRKPNTTCPGSVASTLDTNKYKFLMKISIEDLEILKAKDENVRKIIKEIEHLSDDFSKLQQIFEIMSSLRCHHQTLEETVKDLQKDVQRQLSDKQTSESQLSLLELTLNTPNGTQHLSVVFSKPIKRTQWEQTFAEAKQKLAASMERYPVPEFLASIPIRKTRAGLQFTCAAPTLGHQKDVWVCNSDGYVGQVCVLSLIPEPTVTSCNGVCNARILCVASVPAYAETSTTNRSVSISIENTTVNHGQSYSNPETDTKLYMKSSSADNIQLDSSSSSDDSDNENQDDCPASQTIGKTQTRPNDTNSDDLDNQQSTMWLGTEDGCIHVYNCTDNIRIKKNKIKIQHVSAVYSILYLDNRVFVSLSNGDIVVYLREQNGWNTSEPLLVTIGNVTNPVTRLTNVHGKLWCSIQGLIKILNTITLQIENQIQISSDIKPITNMVVSGNYVWISIQNSAYIKCFHSNSYDFLFEVNLAPPVNKMLSNCDDIIRQHKAACLRVTSLLASKDLVWVGTSAGVLLTISASQASSTSPIVTGIPYGHTGHVRFLTCVDYVKSEEASKLSNVNRHTLSKLKTESTNTLIISGGDGYEDFRNSGVNPLSEVAGREDSTNHLLLWQV